MLRAEFIRHGLALGGACLLTGFDQAQAPLFEADQIDEFVGAAHSDLVKTQKLLKANPLLLNGASQLAKGDFETAMGGASHMGRKDIVDLLLVHGARMDVFTLAFLGYADTIKRIIGLHPELLHSYGPHGFTLLHHAKAGNHSDLASWLMDQGLERTIFDDLFDF